MIEGNIRRGGTKPATDTPRPAVTPLSHTINPYTAYNEIATSFVESTLDLDMSDLYDRFLPLLPRNAHILDAGAGSGRDSEVFLNRGFDVTIMEPSSVLATKISSRLSHEVLIQSFQHMRQVEEFDGIWACASLLHVPEWELCEVFTRLEYALKRYGILYYSFKYGRGTQTKHNIPYVHMTERDILSYLSRHFEHIDFWITDDVRPDRLGLRWLNGILKKI